MRSHDSFPLPPPPPPLPLLSLKRGQAAALTTAMKVAGLWQANPQFIRSGEGSSRRPLTKPLKIPSIRPLTKSFTRSSSSRQSSSRRTTARAAGKPILTKHDDFAFGRLYSEEEGGGEGGEGEGEGGREEEEGRGGKRRAVTGGTKAGGVVQSGVVQRGVVQSGVVHGTSFVAL